MERREGHARRASLAFTRTQVLSYTQATCYRFLHGVDEISMKRCSACATEYPDTFRVCPKDGSKLDDETVLVAAPTIPEGGETAPVSADFLVAHRSVERIGSTIAGRFRIETKLGEGGMGAVYKAEHIKMNRPCAIKILSASALNDPEALPRFTREAQMSSRIDHPHAVTIYDYGESEDGLVYLAMEYIEGHTLTKVLEADGMFPLERVIAVVKQIGDALDAAHALGIVHRDLKPDNIMLTKKGSGADFVKVLDFGIAKMAESEDKRNDLTQAGLIIGTPFYMSPEQVSGEKLDARSDVYSFALIVYEMLAGALPFEGQNTQAVMVSRLVTAPKPIRWINPNISPLIDSAVMRALERDRNLRTPTAGQFVRDLVDAFEGRVPTQPGGMQAVGAPITAPQPKPDTVAVAAPQVQAPLAAPFGQVVPPTDAHPPPAGYAPTAVEPAQWGVASSPQPAGFGHHTPSPGYAQPAPKKSGKGVGIILGVLALLLLVVGVGGVGIFGYTQGWFSRGTTTAGPTTSPTTGPTTVPTTGPSTGTTSDPATNAEADRLFDEGYKLQVAGKEGDAIEKYVQAIAKNPSLVKAHRNLGAAYVNTGRFQDAVKSLETAQKLDAKPDPQVLTNLGLAYFKLKDYQKAAESFEKAAPLGNDAEAYAYAGFAYDNAGNPSLAREAYTKFLAKDPGGDLAPLVKEVMSGKAKAPTAEDFAI